MLKKRERQIEGVTPHMSVSMQPLNVRREPASS